MVVLYMVSASLGETEEVIWNKLDMDKGDIITWKKHSQYTFGTVEDMLCRQKNWQASWDSIPRKRYLRIQLTIIPQESFKAISNRWRPSWRERLWNNMQLFKKCLMISDWTQEYLFAMIPVKIGNLRNRRSRGNSEEKKEIYNQTDLYPAYQERARIRMSCNGKKRKRTMDKNA